MKTSLVAVGIIAGLLAFTPAATADTITVDFTVANSTSALGTYSPYGSVTLTLNAGKIDFSVQMLNGFGLMQDSFGFNSPVVGLLGQNFSSAAYSAWAGSGNLNGFGNFVYKVDGPNPGSGLMVSNLTFTVAKPSGSFSTVNELINANATGYTFGAHVYNPQGPTNAQTGFVANGTITRVPDGGTTLMLLGGALVGIGALRRRLCA